MGLSIEGVRQTEVRLRRIERRTSKRLLEHMRKSALEIRDLARMYAPVDEGNLEEAIEVIESTERFLGNRRNIELIGVDPDKLGEGYSAYGFRYDIAMHEGSYQLGPRSRAKAESTGKEVGPKYLTRAWKELEPEITAEARRIAFDSVDER